MASLSTAVMEAIMPSGWVKWQVLGSNQRSDTRPLYRRLPLTTRATCHGVTEETRTPYNWLHRPAPRPLWLQPPCVFRGLTILRGPWATEREPRGHSRDRTYGLPGVDRLLIPLSYAPLIYCLAGG